MKAEDFLIEKYGEGYIICHLPEDDPAGLNYIDRLGSWHVQPMTAGKEPFPSEDDAKSYVSKVLKRAEEMDREPQPLRRLSVYGWYSATAVYLDGALILYRRSGDRRLVLDGPLMQELGFEVHGEYFDTHNKAPEMDWSPDDGYWIPPRDEATLLDQIKRRDRRKRLERIAELTNELARYERLEI
jgi:hypothetical protein